MRRYDDPVEVCKEDDRPTQFLWHGRLWQVREVLAHWVETGPWWQGTGARAALGTESPESSGAGAPAGAEELLAERELWRVEARRPPGRSPEQERVETTGVFDLSFSWSEGCWQLIRCAD